MSYNTITDSEIANGKPITPSLLRKFRDNIYGHSHIGGQGGALVAGSFADNCVIREKVTDRTLGPSLLVAPINVYEFGSNTLIKGFFQDQNVNIFTLDPEFSFEYTATYPINLIIYCQFSFPTIGNNARIELGIFEDGILLSDSKIKFKETNTARASYPAPLTTHIFLNPLAGTHSYQLGFRNLSGFVISSADFTLGPRRFFTWESHV